MRFVQLKIDLQVCKIGRSVFAGVKEGDELARICISNALRRKVDAVSICCSDDKKKVGTRRLRVK